MQSNGGITTAARAAREPVRTILSGPAGGVVAAAWLAKQLGAPRAISFDMGGTSSDVSLLAGAPHTTNETTIDGLPVAVPVIDIHSVGAGGGSLARIDAGGALRVGPESAGALPGPICYGRGGQQPTVTDANLILGRLDQEFFLGGTFRLKLEVTEKAFREFLGRSRLQTRNAPRSLNSPVDLAHGIIAVSNAAMERALRVISVERGHDPRDFILICFGGAGGLHAAALARSLGIPKIVVPRNPGAFSASGILLSDIIKDVSQSVLLAVPDVSERAGHSRPGDHSSRNFHALLHELEGEFTRLTEKVTAELRREYPDSSGRKRRGKLSIDRRIDVRYRGQSYELSIPFSSHFRGQFQQAHQQAYGYSHRGQALEIVNLRVRLIVATPKPKPVSLRPAPFREAPVNRAVLKRKRIWWDTRLQTTTFYTREHLPPFSRIRGPAIIAEYSSTTAVPPDWACQVDRLMNLELTRVA